MAKNDNVRARKLYEAINSCVGAPEADRLADTLPLSASADYSRKFKWAGALCEYLESNFTPEQVERIRLDCHCTPSEATKAKIKRIFGKSTDLKSFCDAYAADGEGSFSLWTEGDALFLCYPRCYCSCVNRKEGLLPKSWCVCSLGYVKDLFDFATGRDTKGELIESVKTGGEKCVIKITNIM